MFKIDTLDAGTVLPTPKPVGVNVDGFFSSGDIGTGAPPTRLTHDVLNALQEEISYVIESQGLTLDKADRTQLYTAIQNIVATLSGSALAAVVDDASPQLGGDLEVNGHSITSSGDLELSATSGVVNFNAHIDTIELAKDLTTNYLSFVPASGGYTSNGFLFQLPSKAYGAFTDGFYLGFFKAITIDNDPTMAANSASNWTTQSATKSYVDTSVVSTEEYQFYFAMNLAVANTAITTARIPMPFDAGNYEVGNLFFCVEDATTSFAVPHQVNVWVYDGTNSTAGLAIHAVAANGQYVSTTASWDVYQSGFNLPGVAFYLQLAASDTTAPGNVIIHLSIRRVS